MGISRLPKSSFLEIWTLPNAVILSDINLDDHELNPFPAIPYTGTLEAAYLDLYIPCLRNVNAGSNYIKGFQLQIKNNGSWYTSMTAPDPSLWMDNSQVGLGGIWLCGTTSISAYVPADTVLYPRMYQHSTDANAIYLYDISCRLRLYFKGGT